MASGSLRNSATAEPVPAPSVMITPEMSPAPIFTLPRNQTPPLAGQYPSVEIPGAVKLCYYAHAGNLEMVKELIESHSVGVNEMDYTDRTALHAAAAAGHAEIVQYLVEHGADRTIQDSWGITPAGNAHHNDRHNTLSVLQRHGSNLSMLERATGPDARLLQHFRAIAGSQAHDKSMSIPVAKLISYLKKRGLNPCLISPTSPLTKEIDNLTKGTDFITWKSFESAARHPTPEGILERAITDRLVIRNWSKFTSEIEEMYNEVKQINGGKVATYIPELGKVNPDLFGVSICTVDGQIFSVGDTEIAFPIQSCGKPVLYSAALEQGSNIDVHTYVGREPSGASFNAFTLNAEDKPHNACINSGAIVVSALYYPELMPADRFNMLSDKLSELTGDEKPGFGLSVFLSEKQTAHTNFALAHFMASKGRFPHDTSIENALDFYFQMCSTELNCRQMAVLAGTYANNGRNPVTKKNVFTPETVKNTVSMLFSCGMYNYSGEWACTVGLPAKSGVSGVIFLVVPGILGVSIFSPPLDSYGNSVKGVEFAKRLADKYKYGLFDVLYKAEPADPANSGGHHPSLNASTSIPSPRR